MYNLLTANDTMPLREEGKDMMAVRPENEEQKNLSPADPDPDRREQLQCALLDCLNGRFSPSDFPPEISAQLNHYHQLIRFEFVTPPLYRKNQSLLSIACSEFGITADILRISPTGTVLFLEEEQKAPRALASKLYERAKNSSQPDCYLSVSRPFYNAEQMQEAYCFAEKQLEERFWDPKVHIFSYDQEYRLRDKQTDPNDNTVVATVKNALAARDSQALQNQLDLLFQKYRRPARQSQIFVKFVFSSVAMAMYPYLPSEADGQKVTLPPPETLITELFMQPDILKIIATIQKMAQYIIQSFETSGKKSRREVLTVQKYIKEHYSADLSLETLSSLVYLTPDYLSRLFKKDTGKSLSQYTRQVRMEKAIELLYTTNKKVVDISAEVGYPNYSYFCQSFREYFGKSPERYRQEECHEAFV